jgi:hypothetical protein
MNVYGRNGTYDRITIGAAVAELNSGRIDFSGIETTRVVTADAGDTVQLAIPAELVSWWDPLSEE